MKDGFRQVFARCSSEKYEAYMEQFVARAPYWLFRSAVQLHAEVDHHPRATAVSATLEAHSARSWNNPELYPHLYELLYGTENVATHMRALETHLNLREVAPDAFTCRYLRLNGPKEPRTFELVDGQVVERPESVLARDTGGPIVYQPLPHLFDDVVRGQMRYCGQSLPLPRAEVLRRYQTAAQILQRYDGTLFEGFRSTIGTVAITGDWHPGSRIRYSTGTVYTGGIFVSACDDSAVLLAESLIHEYYHQRLWLWWLIQPPSDLPNADATLVSPISGLVRSARVMMHALLIYASLADFYHWVESELDSSSWVRDRSSSLRHGGFELRRRLRAMLADGGESLRFVDAIRMPAA